MKPLNAFTVISGFLWFRGTTTRYAIGRKQATAEELGLQRVISLCPRPDPDWFEICQYDPLYFPDGQQDPPDWLPHLALEVANERHPTLVFCYGGVNRSALLAAMILREVSDCTGAEALQRIRDIKQTTFTNEHFVDYLIGLDDPTRARQEVLL